MAQETISDWSTNALSNTPANGTALTTTGDGTLNDKAFQEPKAVVREESLNKGFEPDVFTASQINSRTFQIAGIDLRDNYAPYDTVLLYKAAGGVTPVTGTIQSISLSGADTRIVLFDVRGYDNAEEDIPGMIDRARFSAFRSRLRFAELRTYLATPSVQLPSFVPRLFQAGTISIRGTDFFGTSFLPFIEPTNKYFVSVQVIDSTGDPPEGAFLLRRVTKHTNKLTVTLCEAPGEGNTVVLEFKVYRHTGGAFV